MAARLGSFLNKLSARNKVFLALAAIAIVLVTVFVFKQKPGSSSIDARINLQGPRATAQINRSFSFPLKDAKGKEISQIGYDITSTEVRDEILVKGQRATAVQGKTFLILELKITNSYSKAIDINTRDYLRLTVNGKNNEMLAADIHNDPANVQANSTKYVRIGFAINDTDQGFVLHVGEINGPKTDLPLNLKIK